MDAIITTYHGATNYRGSRITARRWTGSRYSALTVEYICELDSSENHDRAAALLAERDGYPTAMVKGELKTGYVYVPVSK